MNPEAARELEDRQESELRPQKEGEERVVVGEESNCAHSEEDKDALIRRLTAELAAKDKDAAAKDQEIARLNVKATRLNIKASVKGLLETHAGIPAMETNTSAKPSIGGGTLKQKRKQASQRGAAAEASKKIAKIAIDDNEGSKQQHEPATIEEMDKKLSHFMEQFDVNYVDQSGDLIKSKIAVGMAENSTNKEAELDNFNEASISFHVKDLLHDVLQCLHLSSSTRVGQEISIFSMRPDVVVVRWKTRIILVIEVKNPGKDGSIVVCNEVAAGQAYDYAMGLRQMGIDHPFVCLSTYNYMRIGTLRASSSEIFTEATDKLKEGPIGNVESELDACKETISPEKKGNLTTVIPADSTQIDLRDGNETSEDESNTSENRVIHFSEVFDRTNMFKALYFAIACGIVAVEKSTNDRNQNLVPVEGEQINRCVAVVRHSSLHWEYLNCKATYQLKRRWHSSLKVYLHCVLGQGCSGKVYLGSDSKGRMFAVKLYLFDSTIMESFRAEDNQEEKKSQKEMLMEIRDAEAEKWTKFYHSYKESIFRGELFGVPCLTMPYVASIPMNRRKGLLSQIKQELKRFADEGFAYTESDLRWRHIGLRKDNDGNEQTILVDLGSMTERGDEVHPDLDRVSPAVEELERRAEQEPVHAPREFIHA